MEPEDNKLLKDGGYASRKLSFCLITSAMILGASRLSPLAGLSEVIAGLVMVCSIYIIGNVMTKWKAGNLEQSKIEAIGSSVVAKAVQKAEEKIE